MAVKVVDASALAAILFDEPEGEHVAEQLRGGRIKAPALLEFELANVRLLKSKRHPEDRQTLVQAFGPRRESDVEYVAVDCDAGLRLGLEVGLTPYDASYLWLARTFGAELTTLDRQPMRAFAD
jgi:predicted nucleic acid-binding protein